MDLVISDQTYTFAQDEGGCPLHGEPQRQVHRSRRLHRPRGRPGRHVRIRGAHTFTHTEVSPAYGGRGIAAHLVRYALETSAEAASSSTLTGSRSPR